VYNEEKATKRWVYWAIVVTIITGATLFVISMIPKTAEYAIVKYEEFQEIYNTCEKLNTDLGIIQTLPEDDKMFEQFSKLQRISTIQQQLNRWVEDYNGKSKMWNRSMWKSASLPYQLSINNFSNMNSNMKGLK
jgi:hypothetical protein